MAVSKLKLFWRESYFIATKNNMSCMSAQLTYAVIMSIVPFLAVFFSFIHSRKNFQNFLDQNINPFIESNFGPNVGMEIINYIHSVVVHIQITELSIISFVSLLVTVMLSLLLIESIFNTISDVKSRSSYFVSLLKCWLILCFLPFLFALDALRSNFLITAFDFAKYFLINEDIRFLNLTIGYLLNILFFSLLYYILPSKKMHFSATFFGGSLAAFSLDVIRHVNIYLVKGAVMADTNQLYGSIPLIAILFFVWLRLIVYVILLGFVLSIAFERVVLKKKHLLYTSEY